MNYDERRAVIKRIEEKETQTEKLNQSFDEILVLFGMVNDISDQKESLRNMCDHLRKRTETLCGRVSALESELMGMYRESALARRRRTREDEEA